MNSQYLIKFIFINEHAHTTQINICQKNFVTEKIATMVCVLFLFIYYIYWNDIGTMAFTVQEGITK